MVQIVLKAYQCGISVLNGSPEAVTHPQIHGLNCLYVNARMRFCHKVLACGRVKGVG